MSRIVKLPVFPPMQCDEGCSECCHAFLVPEADYQRIRRIVKERKIRLTVYSEDPSRCPLFTPEDRCSIYEDRPAICRAFGHIERLTCPRGYNTNIPEEPVAAAIKSRGVAVRLLHELIAEEDPAAVDLEALWTSLLGDAQAEGVLLPDYRRRVPQRKS